MKLNAWLAAAAAAAGMAALAATGCASGAGKAAGAGAQGETAGVAPGAASGVAPGEAQTSLPKVDMAAWQYNADDDVYWQIGIQYVEKPADRDYETLGLFVPGAFFTAEPNGDGTYTATVNGAGSAGGFTAADAPYVMPIQTPGYAALLAPVEYPAEVKQYTDAGFVFVFAGARGSAHGAPSGITDFKAAIRYVRYNAGLLPGDTGRYFSFGMSGGGAQSALLGATGDAAEYEPYLEAVGAVRGMSDAIMGSMDWCPITNLNVANGAYEWEMGAARSGLDEDMQALSDGLARRFALYINELGLTDRDGNALTLEQSEDGLYHAGSYYGYLKGVIEESLNNFLADTEFPYSPEQQKRSLGVNMILTPDVRAFMGSMPDFAQADGVERGEKTSGVTLSGTYGTAEDYIAALNARGEWVRYDADTNTASVSSVEDFMKAVKLPFKSVAAFDALTKSQPENMLFGYNEGAGAHWDAAIAEVLEGTATGDAYAADLTRTDALGNTVGRRLDMYNPMFYLSPYYKGYKTSTPAKYWRIRTGIFQGDTAISTELDYTLALYAYGAPVQDVDFATVWGLPHVEAERASEGDGTSTGNFIAWVQACLAQE